MRSNEHPQRLLAYLDGELSDEETARVNAHLVDCEACSRELSGHRQLHAFVDGASKDEIERGLWDELQVRLHPSESTWMPRAAWAGYLMVTLVGLGVGGWAGWSMSEDLGGRTPLNSSRRLRSTTFLRRGSPEII